MIDTLKPATPQNIAAVLAAMEPPQNEIEADARRRWPAAIASLVELTTNPAHRPGTRKKASKELAKLGFRVPVKD